MVHLRCKGFYTFAVSIHYDFGLDLPLLLTEDEALHVAFVAKVNHPKSVIG